MIEYEGEKIIATTLIFVHIMPLLLIEFLFYYNNNFKVSLEFDLRKAFDKIGFEKYFSQQFFALKSALHKISIYSFIFKSVFRLK